MDHDVSSGLNSGTAPERASLWEEWPCWLLLLGVWGFSLWAWPRLPAQVPIHWGISGNPDRWATPREAALLLPALLTGIYGITLLFLNGRFDFKAARLMDPVLARRIRLLVIGLFGVLQGLMLGIPLRGGTLGIRTIDLVLAAFFIFLGNLMPLLEPNAWVGIRLPPTLEDREVWRRTHRLGGRVFVVGGLLQLLAGQLPQPIAQPVILTLMFVMFLVPVIYAYRIRTA
jgi:uncharacterized membrane protein